MEKKEVVTLSRESDAEKIQEMINNFGSEHPDIETTGFGRQGPLLVVQTKTDVYLYRHKKPLKSLVEFKKNRAKEEKIKEEKPKEEKPKDKEKEK